MKRLRNHGMSPKYQYQEVGWNSRLDSLQARVLRRNLKTLDARNSARREVASRLHAAVSMNPNLRCQSWSDESVWHLFVVLHERPEACMEKLKALGIETNRYYHTPLHKTKAYWTGQSLPVAEEVCAQMFAIPCFASMTDEEVERVCEAVSTL